VKKIFTALFLLCFSVSLHAQTVSQLKKILDTSSNPIGYVKFKLKKKFTIDTISVTSTTTFMGTANSLAYYGKEGKVYGPYIGKNEKYLIKILMKAPNMFYHVSHILLDTAVFHAKFADSLANTIIDKIRTGKSTFELMAKTYSADNNSAAIGGDLGWFSRGAMMPQLERALAKHKKGDVFKVWTRGGVHIIKLTDDPKKDVGFALILKVIL
jgi:hypothetical protein